MIDGNVSREERKTAEWEKRASFTLSGVRSPVGPRSANTAVKPLVKEKLNLSGRERESHFSMKTTTY